MPIYEYRRSDGSTFEVMQSFSDPPLKKDPETGLEVERVFHAPAVHFKGKGFYNTDYGTRKRQKETAAAGEGSGGDGASSNGAGKSEGAGGESKSSGETKSTPETKTPAKSGDGAKAKSTKPVAA